MTRAAVIRLVCSSFCLFALAGCASLERLRLKSMPSKLMHRDMQYTVFVPRQAKQPLPLVVFLHGMGDGPGALESGGVTRLLDRPGAPRAIIVSPQGDRGFWENWANGERPYRDWILQELIPLVQQRYPTLPCPRHCHVMGISMGGHGAISMLLHAPGSFRSVTALSPPVFEAEKVVSFYESFWWRLLMPVEDIWGPYRLERAARNDAFRRLTRQADLAGSHLALAWGDRERPQTRSQLRRFATHLKSHGIQHTAWQFPGEHQWEAWAPVIVEALELQLSDPGAGQEAEAQRLTTPLESAAKPR